MTGAALMSHLAEEGLLPNGRNCASLTPGSNFTGTGPSVAPSGPAGTTGFSLDLS